MLKNSTQPAGAETSCIPGKFRGSQVYLCIWCIGQGYDLWYDRNVLHDLFHRHH